MSEVSSILDAISHGDPTAAEHLLPLVYEELRRLATQELANEKVGQTLQPTALVHEAYLRLVDAAKPTSWNSRGHFYAAAAQAMRRILVENARRKQCLKRGGDRGRVAIDEQLLAEAAPREDLLALDAALHKLTEKDAGAANLVQLRYFAGLTLPEAAAALGISPRTAGRLWAFARAWLRREIEG